MSRPQLSVVMTTLSLSLMVLPTAATAQAAVDEHTTQVAEGVYAYGSTGGGYLSMFVLTDEGVVVVEPRSGFARHRRGSPLSGHFEILEAAPTAILASGRHDHQ